MRPMICSSGSICPTATITGSHRETLIVREGYQVDIALVKNSFRDGAVFGAVSAQWLRSIGRDGRDDASVCRHCSSSSNKQSGTDHRWRAATNDQGRRQLYIYTHRV